MAYAAATVRDGIGSFASLMHLQGATHCILYARMYHTVELIWAKDCLDQEVCRSGRTNLRYDGCMLNFAGQDVRKGSYVIQCTRTNKGMKRRVGVVLAEYAADEEYIATRMRMVWCVPEEGFALTDGIVAVDDLIVVDPSTLHVQIGMALRAAQSRGHAAFSE